jgi:hypothetical protein
MRPAMGSWMGTRFPSRMSTVVASGRRCRSLGVSLAIRASGWAEHNKRAGDPVGRGDGVVGDEAPGDGPAFLVIDVRQSTLGGAAGMRRWRRR